MEQLKQHKKWKENREKAERAQWSERRSSGNRDGWANQAQVR